MTLYVITRWQPNTSPGRPGVIATTDLPCHLYAVYQNTKPSSTPRYTYTRGVPRLCGFYYNWQYPTCREQIEPGPTTEHTFQLPYTSETPEYWVITAEQCPPDPKDATSFPMPIPTIPQPVLPGEIDIQGTETHVLNPGDLITLTWDTIALQINWPLPSLPFQTFDIPAVDTYNSTLEWGIQTVLDASYHVEITGAGGSPLWQQGGGTIGPAYLFPGLLGFGGAVLPYPASFQATISNDGINPWTLVPSPTYGYNRWRMSHP